MNMGYENHDGKNIPYLTFKNAKEAMDYYVQAFWAEITYHQSLTEEQAENRNATDDESLRRRRR